MGIREATIRTVTHVIPEITEVLQVLTVEDTRMQEQLREQQVHRVR